MEHKLLDIAQHLSTYIIGVVTMVVGGIGMMFRERRKIKKETAEIRTLVLHLKENSATHADLRKCRRDVDTQDTENLKAVLNEIRVLRTDIKQDTKDNHAAHDKIMLKMLELHSK